MKKNGFTLVELLSVIVLLSLLIGIAIPGISRIRDNVNKRALEKKMRLVESAAILWGQDNKTRLQSRSCTIDDTYNISCYIITIKELIEDNYLDADKYDGEDEPIFYNPINNSSLNDTFVYVYKKNNRVYSCYALENDTDGNNNCIQKSLS